VPTAGWRPSLQHRDFLGTYNIQATTRDLNDSFNRHRKCIRTPFFPPPPSLPGKLFCPEIPVQISFYYSGGRNQEDHSWKPAQAEFSETLSGKKTLHKNRAVGLAQGEGSEFKSQYWKKNPSPGLLCTQ
jgi:hypothetical protein